MQNQYAVVLANRKRPDHECLRFFLEWDDPAQVFAHPKRNQGEGILVFDVFGIEIEGRDQKPREFPVCLEVAGSDLEIVVNSRDPDHFHPERYVFSKGADGKWACLEEWSPNQTQHDLEVRSEVRCGTAGLDAICEILRPKVSRASKSNVMQLLAA